MKELAADAAGQADLEGLALVVAKRSARVTAGFFSRASASVLAGRTFTGCAKAGTLPMTAHPVPAKRKFLNVVTSSPQIVRATELLAECAGDAPSWLDDRASVPCVMDLSN
ncbi:hypothetical protein J1C56_26945 [Aminobacter anthyllidis]|uniref:Uncharacterized protein n=1 Tax=Aminobacter anthyllidis TaxID=1035067 RepID=A0A9X1AFX9_9HYPH|nr:hypothetical protein [Aminobacter anthyllidis]MBT1159220.1 hypothetical protein [Aminobacter anthyllidis]